MDTSIIQKLALSYECALAIGNSLDLAEMLHEVIHTIVHKTSAHRGIIWVRDEKEKEFQPIASAGIRIKDVLAQKDISSLIKHFKRISKSKQFVLKYKDDKDFLRYCTVITGKEESVLIIPVKNMAMVHLIYASREIVNEGLVNLLTALSQKLCVAIDACLAHENIVEEIRGRKEVEEQLRSSEEQYRITIDSIGKAVHVVDENLCIILFNDTFRRWNRELGLKTENLIGRNLFDIFSFLPDGIRDEYRQVFKTGKLLVAVEMNEIAGRRIVTETRKIPILENKKVVRVVTVVEDITERKEAEAELKQLFVESEESRRALLSILEDVTETQRVLKESEERFQDVVSNSGEWIWEMDTDGCYTYSSPVVEQVLGYTPDEVVGRYFYDFFHPDGRDELKKSAFTSFERKQSFRNIVNRNLHKDGHTVILETSGVPILDNKGNLLGYRGADRDITERRQMEEELLKAEKLKSLEFLAGGIAHDFNNILTVILGNISLAEMYVSPEEDVSRILKDVERASLRARGLAQQLITFSKGGAPIRKPTSIAAMLMDTVLISLTDSNVRCQFFVDNDLWLVNVDEGQFNQAISNLALNARQALPEGGRIKVKAKNITVENGEIPTLQKGRYVRISIEDQGIGIPKEHLPKIFDPYFTTKQKGSGLGLATTYSVVKRHNGYISVESEVGIGTTFYIYLPVSKEQITISKQKVGGVIKGTGKILLMDDEDVILKSSGRLLRYLGYKVKFAKDGKEAIELCKKAKKSGRPFDAVIVDLVVPGGMGGKDIIERLIKIDAEVKVIVSSGYSSDPVMTEYKRYGFSGIIRKPYEIQELSEVLHEVIKRRRSPSL